MALKVKSIIITGYGTNCEMEMAHACRLAGSDVADIVHISDILSGEKRITDYHFLNLPGGFLDGDNLGAAQAGAHRFKHAVVAGSGQRIMDQLLEFVREGGLILGICNGFQLMVKTGLLPAFENNHEDRKVSLTYNDSGRFEDRWVTCLAEQESPCVFTRGIETMDLPVRHGEGKFVTIDRDTRERLYSNRQVVLKYIDPDTGAPTMEYPLNPNGSEDAIAGICDPTGRLMGLMPHPEAFCHCTNHPAWPRRKMPEEGGGLKFFINAVEYIRKNI
jgi:phosphoribosylformylglycinamidine synthase